MTRYIVPGLLLLLHVGCQSYAGGITRLDTPEERAKVLEGLAVDASFNIGFCGAMNGSDPELCSIHLPDRTIQADRFRVTIEPVRTADAELLEGIDAVLLPPGTGFRPIEEGLFFNVPFDYPNDCGGSVVKSLHHPFRRFTKEEAQGAIQDVELNVRPLSAVEFWDNDRE